MMLLSFMVIFFAVGNVLCGESRQASFSELCRALSEVDFVERLLKEKKVNNGL